MIDHATRYDLMTTDQVPPQVISEWMSSEDFAAYVAQRRRYGQAPPKRTRQPGYHAL